MKKNSFNHQLGMLIVSCTLWSAAVPAAVLDFDATTAGDYLFASYDEDGFRLSVTSGHYDFFGPGTWCNLTSGVCTSNFLNVDDSAYGPATMRLAPVGGGQFDLASFDVLDVYQYNQQTYQYSTCDSGCVVSSSKGGSAQLVAGTMNFSAPEWTGVDWIEFTAARTGLNPWLASTAIDNINVTAAAAVPVPAAAWLLVTGFASVAGRLRRRTAR